ncbi:EF-hand domain-containing protein [Chelativorans sp. YIM 93263]|uniref:EF-hand domain-containing protein n=1 Tax=Chelativorans sp. YIM 93263 TaxID=2906648 RepID=UPI0023796E35|nr:EF-hand domain-containing protein [Chelativorans sp. YIM 93263]
MNKLVAFSLSSALLLSAGPALAQDGATQPDHPTPGAPARDMDRESSGMDRNSMREMMRDMIEEMTRGDGTEQGDTVEGQPEPPDLTDGDAERSGPSEMRTESRRQWGQRDRRSRMHRDRRMGEHGMMRRHHGGAQAFHGARMKIMFTIVDANGDGALSIDEVNDFHGRIFNAIDEDGNGSVTMSEIRGFFRGGAYGVDGDDTSDRDENGIDTDFGDSD